MPNAAINALTAPDSYTPQSTLDTGNWLDHANIDVLNQAIYWSMKQAPPRQAPGAGSWGPDIYMAPGSRSIYRDRMTGIRIRAAIPAASLPATATQAVVTVEVVS